ncbi:MAG: phage terminase large subunit family protein [Cyanobium sp. 49614_E6]|nr:phage terminase large subunit family protein [Cyanobium sp. 49614_E6]
MSVWRTAFMEGLRPEQPLTVSEWADKHRRLSSKASAEPGPWRTNRTPYLREPMDCLSTTSNVQRVVMMFAAQTGKTESGSNWLGYVIAHAPGPMLLVQPTVEMAKRLSKQRLESLVTETPVLAEKIAPSRSRDSGNTMFSKEFPGGMMLLTGANSATGLRSTPCRYIFCDEVDAFPLDVDGEGDPVSLAEKRATTFARRKILLTSTPTVKDFSRIEAEFERSDQRRFFVPCPSCGAMQWLKWPQLKWENNDPATAVYECEHCGERFAEIHKPAMLRQGEWRATAPSDGKTAGFQLSGLYSPLGWLSWADMVDDFLRAKSDAPMLKSFVNTRLAETWEEDFASKVSASALLERCEAYPAGRLPDGALAVTIGVDVQGGGGSAGDRLAVSVWAWGREEEGWLIDHQEIAGDPCKPEVWKQLDLLVLHEWEHASGGKLRADVVAVDSGGHATAEVYQYARERQSVGVIAIKGQSQRGKPPIGKPTKVDINAKGQTLKRGALVFPVGGDTGKTTLFGRLKHNEPGGGYLHFHAQTGEEYFEQLTAEKQALRYVKGFPVREWVKKPSARNEALDCLVYAYAALNRMYQRYDRRTIWDQLEKRLQDGDVKPAKPRLRSGGAAASAFVNSW